jgi:uncharacterized LabA/DUF88 family protein
MGQNILFIDGENFLHKVKEVLEKQKKDLKKINLALIDINFLLEKAFEGHKIERKIFYAAKLHFHKESEKKSLELMNFQRALKTNLEKQGFEFLIAGHVRGQAVRVDRKSKIIFKEKGVDVKIAVDMVSFSADKIMNTAILCSSDSDLQPAIQEARKRGSEIIYLGFEYLPNKGLTYTTNRTVLFRNSEILEACRNKK